MSSDLYKMNNYSIALIVCFALFQLVSTEDKVIKECLVENGYKESDIKLLASLAKEEPKDEDKDKLSCVLACIFRKENPESSLPELLNDIVVTDIDKTETLRKEMLDTLNTCKAQAGNDNCKLLQCIKITELPYADVLYTIKANRVMQKCFVDNGLKASDALTVDQITGPASIRKILEKLDEDKFACAVACIATVAASQDKKTPNKTLQSGLLSKIDSNFHLTDDQKKGMTETLNKCATEVAGDNCKLVKCIKIFRDPYINLWNTLRN